MAKIAVIGSGFSGLSAAAYLGKAGHKVLVFEKNDTVGGRARQLNANGYVFDMGPSWYWMPEVFEDFFADMNTTVSQQYDLTLLDPGFVINFGEGGVMKIPAKYEELRNLFESIEPGSALRLDAFMKEAAYKYKTGMQKMAQMPGLSVMEFLDMDVISGVFRMQLFTGFSKHVRKYFTHPQLIALMEFPVLFLGAMPSETPALYSLMNYAGLKLGTWYPGGGFGSVVNAMKEVVTANGGTFHFNSPVEKIETGNNLVTGVRANGENFEVDSVVSSADYHFTEQNLLEKEYRNYDEDYWDSRTLAPSALIYYVGVSKKIPGLNHHTLFFESPLESHSHDIYVNPKWPENPLFYLCCPSKTDNTVAPEGHENLFFLMPLAPGIRDEPELREEFFNKMLERVEKLTGFEIKKSIDYKQSYCVKDFINDYHSYKGNAYGLANTLRQTAILKPKMKNRKLKNMFYTGQFTVPGPGVPPSIISGKIVSSLIVKHLCTVSKKNSYEAAL